MPPDSKHEPTEPPVAGCRDVDAAVRGIEGVDAGAVRRAAADRTPSRSTVLEDHERVLFEVEGLDCTTCEALVERTLSAVDGVSNVTACRREGAVRIDRDPEIGGDTLRRRIEAIGYPVRSRDRVVENRRRREYAEARFVVGIMAGLMMLAPYAGVIYPTRVSYPFFDAAVVAHLEAALASAWAPYFYLNLALLSGIVLLWTGRPILREAATAVRSRAPNHALVVAGVACGLYLYSTVVAFVGLDGGVYYDFVVLVVVGVTVAREADLGVGSTASDEVEATAGSHAPTAGPAARAEADDAAESR